MIFPWRPGRRNEPTGESPSSPPRPRKIFGRLSRTLLFAALFLAVLTALLFAFGALLTTAPAEQWIKGRLETLLTKTLHARVKVGSLDTDLLTKIEVRNIEVYPSDPSRTEPIARLDVLRVDYPTLPLLKGRWFLRRVHLGRLQVLLRREASGRWDIPLLDRGSSQAPRGPAVTTKGFQVGFRRFDVDRLEVVLRDEKEGHHATLDCRNGVLTRNVPDWSLEASVRSLRADGQVLVEAAPGSPDNLKVKWNTWLFRLDRAHLSFLGGRLEARGRMFRNGTFQDAALDIHGADLARAARVLRLPQAPFQGVMDASVRVSGNPGQVNRLNASMEARITPRASDEGVVEPIALHIAVARGSLDASLEEADNELLLKAQVDRQGVLTGLVTASLASLGSLTRLAGWGDVTGSLAATGDISGPWRSPRLDLRLDGGGILVSRIPVDKIGGRVLWDAQGLRCDHLTLTGAVRSIQSGRARGDRTQRRSGPLAGLSGGVSYHLSLDGPLANPTARLSADLKRPGWGALKFDRAALRATLENHRLRLDLLKGQRDFTVLQCVGEHDLARGNGTLELSLTESKGAALRGEAFAVPLPPGAFPADGRFSAHWERKRGGAWQGAAACRSFDLARLGNLMPSIGRLAGRFTADLLAQRSAPARPLKVTGRAQVRDGLWQSGYSTVPVQGLQADVEWNGSHLKLTNGKGTIRSTSFEARGEAALPGTESPWDLLLLAEGRPVLKVVGRAGPSGLDLGVTLDRLPAVLAEPFLTFFRDMKGSFSSEVRVGGTFQRPTFHGPFHAEDLDLFLPVLNVRLSKGDLTAALEGERVTLQKGLLLYGGGPLTLTGTTAWGPDGLADFSYQGRFSKARVDMPGLMKGTLSKGNFSWAKDADGYLLSAEVDLSEGRWMKAFQYSDSTPAALPDLLKRTRFSVRFRGSQNLWLDNNLAKIPVEADAALTGTWAAPTLLGQFTATEGSVQYLDRRFAVRSASADFNDATRINPQLNLQAATTVRSFSVDGSPIPYEVQLSVTGPLDQMVISLTSEPTLDPGDIATLLTFGATQQQLMGGNPQGTGPSTGGTLLTRAGSVTSQTLSDYSARKVGQWMGLDELSVQGSPIANGGAEAEGPTLTATTRITDRVSVTYRTNTGANPQRSVRIGYYLSNRFSIVTEDDQTGTASVDLKYRLLFR